MWLIVFMHCISMPSESFCGALDYFALAESLNNMGRFNEMLEYLVLHIKK